MAYPDFIFQDAIPAQQMMEHERAINEGMRIQELGKARQAEGLFRMAQLRQQAQQQQETNQLNQLIAQSRIAQDQIGNSFRERELAQRGELTREGYKNTLEAERIRYPHGMLSGTEAAMNAKIAYDREQALKEEAENTILEKQWNDLENQIQAETSKEFKPNTQPGVIASLLSPALAGYAAEYVPFLRSESAGAANEELAKAKEKSTKTVNSLRQAQMQIEAILSGRGKVPRRITTPAAAIAPPRVSVAPAGSAIPASQLSPGRVMQLQQGMGIPTGNIADEIARRRAEWIRAGGDTNIFDARAAQYGVR